MSSTKHFRIGHVDEASALVVKHHYSRRIPSNIQMCATWHEAGGLFGDYGPAFAACMFTIPGTRWSEEVWELARLVKLDEANVPLTGLISDCCSYIRRTKGIDLLVSFADWTQQHHGGIYQAASWNFGGLRKPRNDGLVIDGVFVPGRSANSRYGTRSVDGVRDLLDDHTVEAHWDEGKYLYWRALTRSGKKKAAVLKLASLPYPKPQKMLGKEVAHA